MARVLVIDDEPDVLLLCRLNLEHAGHEVLQALDGKVGLALARDRRPDVIVLDLMMPMMDGYEVLAELGHDARTAELPVVVLTAKAQLEERVRCWREGAAEFLAKPFAPQALNDLTGRLVAMTPQERAWHREEALRELGSTHH